MSDSDYGRFVRAVPVQDDDRSYDLAAAATVRSALLRNSGGESLNEIAIAPGDIHKKVYQRQIKSLVVFVVDSSESMGDEGAQFRIKAAKGTILGILNQAYQKRFKVGLVSFADDSAEIILQPTSSLTLAQKCLGVLPVGGATPFGHGLMKGWQLIKSERRKDRDIRPLMVILSDGEANVAYDGAASQDKIIDELLRLGTLIGNDDISSLVIETRPLSKPSNTMRELAAALGGTYYHSSAFKNSDLLQAVAAF